MASIRPQIAVMVNQPIKNGRENEEMDVNEQYRRIKDTIDSYKFNILGYNYNVSVATAHKVSRNQYGVIEKFVASMMVNVPPVKLENGVLYAVVAPSDVAKVVLSVEGTWVRDLNRFVCSVQFGDGRQEGLEGNDALDNAIKSMWHTVGMKAYLEEVSNVYLKPVDFDISAVLGMLGAK